MLTGQKILVLSPHTDDGELGCGASIARFCEEGKDVRYIAFSLCAKSLPPGMPANTLETECRKATKELGVPANNLSLFDFEVRNFDRHRQELLEILVGAKKEYEPDIVFLPSSSDMHQDHAVIHTEGMRAFKQCTVIGYELPWNQRDSRFNCFISISAGQLDKKISALKYYESQARRAYMSEDFARSLATIRGVQAGAAFAEAFEVYGMLVK